MSAGGAELFQSYYLYTRRRLLPKNIVVFSDRTGQESDVGNNPNFINYLIWLGTTKETGNSPEYGIELVNRFT